MLQFTTSRLRDEQFLRAPRTPGTSVCLASGSAACHANNRARDSAAPCFVDRRLVRREEDATVTDRARRQCRLKCSWSKSHDASSHQGKEVAMLHSYLISVAIKSTVLLAAGVFSLRLLRRQDAALRHLVCLAALASAAAVPLLALWSPQWSVLISVPASSGAGSGGNTLGSGWASWPMALATIWVLGTSAMVVRALGGWIML